MVAAFSITGCMYTEADMASDSTSAAGPAGTTVAGTTNASYLAAAAQTAPVLDDRHSEVDVQLVRAALEHYRVAGRMAALMKQQGRLDEGYHALADRILEEQRQQVPALEGMLAAWDEQLHQHQPPVDGVPPARSTGELNLQLLDLQDDALGFGPFWVISVRTQQNEFMETLDAADRELTSPAAQRFAEQFRGGFASIDADLVDLGA